VQICKKVVNNGMTKSKFLKVLETALKEDGFGMTTDTDPSTETPSTLGTNVSNAATTAKKANTNLKQQALAVMLQDPEFQAAHKTGDQTKINSYIQSVLQSTNITTT
jgi:hypothetical protein